MTSFYEWGFFFSNISFGASKANWEKNQNYYFVCVCVCVCRVLTLLYKHTVPFEWSNGTKSGVTFDSFKVSEPCMATRVSMFEQDAPVLKYGNYAQSHGIEVMQFQSETEFAKLILSHFYCSAEKQ
ncbi:hypothetical protein E2320_005525, partial [Naja naja]